MDKRSGLSGALFAAAVLCMVAATAVTATTGEENTFPAAEPGLSGAELDEVLSGVSPDLDNTAIATEIFNRVNAKRAASGKAPLTRTLDTSAQNWAEHMRDKKKLSHYLAPGVHGQNVATMVSGNGVTFACGGAPHNVPDTEVGIAKFTMHQFMKHDACMGNGHRKNILRGSFHSIGVGVAYGSHRYWICQNFAY